MARGIHQLTGLYHRCIHGMHSRTVPGFSIGTRFHRAKAANAPSLLSALPRCTKMKRAETHSGGSLAPRECEQRLLESARFDCTNLQQPAFLGNMDESQSPLNFPPHCVRMLFLRCAALAQLATMQLRRCTELLEGA
jgi:hypothetical protein